jgi:hypothetical protein
MANEGDREHRAVRSEAHGPHWVAWVEDAAGKPEQAVVLVGLTKKEAEEKARRWHDEQTRSSA